MTYIPQALLQGATFGDVNADGRLELAFATNTGAVYLVEGATGHDLLGFPFRTRGRIMAPVLLTRAMAATAGLQAVVPSSDGHLYVIDAATGEESFDRWPAFVQHHAGCIPRVAASCLRMTSVC